MVVLDQDGDLDIVAHPLHEPDKVIYFNDGKGRFTKSFTRVHYLVRAWGDIDGDDDLDALTFDGTWYEQRGSGDSNGDGVFNSTDLVVICQAGEYDDWFSQNSTFQTGDWNGDGDFDSSELVLTFQEGHYQAAAVPGESQIAAAVDLNSTSDDQNAKGSQAFAAW